MMAISKKEKKSALPMPLILDNSIDSYLENEDDDFILSDNSLLEEEGSLEKRGEKQYILPVLHHRPKIRFSITTTREYKRLNNDNCFPSLPVLRMDAFNAETNEETIHSIPALFRCSFVLINTSLYVKLQDQWNGPYFFS